MENMENDKIHIPLIRKTGLQIITVNKSDKYLKQYSKAGNIWSLLYKAKNIELNIDKFPTWELFMKENEDLLSDENTNFIIGAGWLLKKCEVFLNGR
jgi:hypothetical protein